MPNSLYKQPFCKTDWKVQCTLIQLLIRTLVTWRMDWWISWFNRIADRRRCIMDHIREDTSNRPNGLCWDINLLLMSPQGWNRLYNSWIQIIKWFVFHYHENSYKIPLLQYDRSVNCRVFIDHIVNLLLRVKITI